MEVKMLSNYDSWKLATPPEYEDDGDLEEDEPELEPLDGTEEFFEGAPMTTYSEWDQRQLDIEGGLDDDKFRAAYNRKQAEAQINLKCLQLVNSLRNLRLSTDADLEDHDEINDEAQAKILAIYIRRARNIFGGSYID